MLQLPANLSVGGIDILLAVRALDPALKGEVCRATDRIQIVNVKRPLAV
jgi:tRNA U34 5-carboxymethylaminomethyl modifying enzyme MnmG/GidA